MRGALRVRRANDFLMARANRAPHLSTFPRPTWDWPVPDVSPNPHTKKRAVVHSGSGGGQLNLKLTCARCVALCVCSYACRLQSSAR